MMYTYPVGKVYTNDTYLLFVVIFTKTVSLNIQIDSTPVRLVEPYDNSRR